MGQNCCYGPLEDFFPDQHTLFYVSRDAVEVIACDIRKNEGQRVYTWDYLIKADAKYCCLFNGNVLITGGREGGEFHMARAVVQSSKAVCEYNPFTHLITPKADMSLSRVGHTLVSDSEAAYALSGLSDYKGTKACEKYCIASETWEAIPDMNAVRVNAAACVHRKRIYVIGGLSRLNSKAVVTMEMFDFVLSRWLPSDLKLPSPLERHACVAYRGGILVFGGYQSDERPNYAAFWLSLTENRVLQKQGIPQEAEFSGQVIVSGPLIFAYEAKAGRRLFIFEDERWTTNPIKISNVAKER